MENFKFNFISLDGVGVDKIITIFNRLLSFKRISENHLDPNNYYWAVGVDVKNRIDEIRGLKPLSIETSHNTILWIRWHVSYSNPNTIELVKKRETTVKFCCDCVYKNLSQDVNPCKYCFGTEEKRNFVSADESISFKKDFVNNIYGIMGKGVDTMPSKFEIRNIYFIAKENIKDVIFNDPATIIIWDDGSKTIVKCGEGEVYDPEKGLAMAIAKAALGNKSNYYDIFKKLLPKEEKEEKVKTDKITPTMVKPGRYATVKELAEKAGVSESTIRGQIRKGKFPGALKQDGSWLIPVSW